MLFDTRLYNQGSYSPPGRGVLQVLYGTVQYMGIINYGYQCRCHLGKFLFLGTIPKMVFVCHLYIVLLLNSGNAKNTDVGSSGVDRSSINNGS
jgi:hypothetical protein